MGNQFRRVMADRFFEFACIKRYEEMPNYWCRLIAHGISMGRLEFHECHVRENNIAMKWMELHRYNNSVNNSQDIHRIWNYRIKCVIWEIKEIIKIMKLNFSEVNSYFLWFFYTVNIIRQFDFSYNRFQSHLKLWILHHTCLYNKCSILMLFSILFNKLRSCYIKTRFMGNTIMCCKKQCAI